MKNLRPWFWGMSVVTALGLVVVALQGRELRSLGDDRAALAARLERQAAESSSVVDSTPAEAARALTAGERLELMNLRRKVTELSDVKRRIARMTNENAALRAQAIAISNRVARPFPPGWMKAAAARQAGFATPESAFESFVWALHHRDTNALFQAIVPEMHETLIRNWTSSGPDGFWKMAEMIPGFRVSKVTPAEVGSVNLDVELVPGMETPAQMKARKVDGAWRLEL